MNRVLSEPRVVVPRWKSLAALAGCTAVIACAGCGKAPEAGVATSSEPAASPKPAKPSLVVQPPAAPPKASAGRVVYVIEGFQAVNSDGTHDVPTGAAVHVVAEEGDEYVIAYKGISVKTPKAYFSETVIEEIAAATPAPSPSVAPVPVATPDSIPLAAEATPEVAAATPAAPEPTPASTPAPTPDPAMAADEARAQELMGQLRTVTDEIRTATDKMEVAPAAEKAAEAARIEKLKKRRDALSESLTEVAKP